MKKDCSKLQIYIYKNENKVDCYLSNSIDKSLGCEILQLINKDVFNNNLNDSNIDHNDKHITIFRLK